jgi:hypothetical protein
VAESPLLGSQEAIFIGECPSVRKNSVGDTPKTESPLSKLITLFGQVFFLYCRTDMQGKRTTDDLFQSLLNATFHLQEGPLQVRPFDGSVYLHIQRTGMGVDNK